MFFFLSLSFLNSGGVRVEERREDKRQTRRGEKQEGSITQRHHAFLIPLSVEALEALEAWKLAYLQRTWEKPMTGCGEKDRVSMSSRSEWFHSTVDGGGEEGGEEADRKETLQKRRSLSAGLCCYSKRVSGCSRRRLFVQLFPFESIFIFMSCSDEPGLETP